MKNSIDNESPDGEIRIEFTGLRPGKKNALAEVMKCNEMY